MTAVDTQNASPEQPAVVGQFRWDGSAISGPESYMKEQGLAMLAAFNAGRITEVMREGYRQHGDAILALMVALQTDYAGWIGYRSLFGAAR